MTDLEYEREISKSDSENARLRYLLDNVYDMVTDPTRPCPNWVGEEIQEMLELHGYGRDGWAP